MIIHDQQKHRLYEDNKILSFVPLSNYAVIRIISFPEDSSYSDICNFITDCYFAISHHYPNLDSGIVFPGTQNPLLAKAAILTSEQLGLDYNIIYDDEEILDLDNFKSQTLEHYCEQVHSLTCGQPTTSFKPLIFVSLLPNRESSTLINPVRFFTTNPNGTFTVPNDMDTAFLYVNGIKKRVSSISHLKK